MKSFARPSSTSMSNSNTYRTNNFPMTNGIPTNAAMESNINEEDQLNRINLKALQNRDPYISKILDQAQRVCVYKFLAEKRQWERKELEGTLFVYERMAAPYHGFVILSTVSRETFVQIIKPCMEFKHTPTYEAFLQYKVDVGDIYGIWFISKNDCPRVTECLKKLTLQAREREQSKLSHQTAISNEKAKNILSLLTVAQEKFQESKKKDNDTNEPSTSLPPLLVRLFSTQDSSNQSAIKGLAVSVDELEKQFLQSSPTAQTTETTTNKDQSQKPVSIDSKSQSQIASSRITPNPNTTVQQRIDPVPIPPGRLMTPADFQRIQTTQSPVLIAPIPIDPSIFQSQSRQLSNNRQFSKEYLRHVLVEMLQNDEDFVTGLYNAYVQKQNLRYHMSC